MGMGLLKKKKKSTKYCESLTESQEQGRLSHPSTICPLRSGESFFLWGGQPTGTRSHIAALQFFFLWIDDHQHHQRSEQPPLL